jgi:alkylation response protein AidB-like acyl-CoA dehydrogenase
MDIIPHPAQLLQADTTQTIRDMAASAEEAGKLLPAQLELIYRQQWFKVLTPKQYGGLELDLNQEVRLIEALAWADGSIGWVVTLCTGAGWFGGFLEPKLAKEVFAQRDVCLAGSGAPTGTATITKNGYLVNGTWKYASGALSTTHFTANCRIMDSNGPVLNNEGTQLIIPFVFKKDEVNIIPAWTYSGMVATGSHSFEVNNVEVTTLRTFRIDANYAHIKHPLYMYPFHQLAEATIAANISGMAIHFMDLCKDVFAKKQVEKNLTTAQSKELNDLLTWSVVRMNQLRATFYDDLDRSWANYAQDNTADREENLKSVSSSSRKLAKKARQIVDDLYPYCGLEAARTTTELNRVWRDVHTASQHALLTFDEQ